MANSIGVNYLKRAGLRQAFLNEYNNTEEAYKMFNEYLFFEDEVELEISRYPIPVDSKLPKRTKGHKARTGINYLYVDYEMERYNRVLEWKRTQDAYNQSPKKHLQLAQGYGRHFSMLKFYCMEELLEDSTGGVETDFYEKTPLAYDSLPITTESTRASNAGGNTISGSGISDPQSILDDIKSCWSRFGSFKNYTNGRSFWQLGPGCKLVFLIPSVLIGEFKQATKIAFTSDGDGTTAASQANAFAGDYDILPLSGLSDTNDWFAVLYNPAQPEHKPFLHLTFTGFGDAPEMRYWDENKSWEADDTGDRWVSWEKWEFTAPHTPNAIIRVKNT